MTTDLTNPYTDPDPTHEPLRTLLERLATLQPELDAIDLDVDLNERDTYPLMVALGVSACSGDPQLIGDRWIKLGVLCERRVITSEAWLELAPAVAWMDRAEGVAVVPDRPFSEYVPLSEEERRRRSTRRESPS